MKLTDIVRSVQTDLPITPRHDSWLSKNANPKYSPRAMEHARAALSSEIGGNRTRKQPFRSSSVGSCKRRRLLAAAGVPALDTIDSKTSNIFGTGNFLHLKWQMAGLTEGWLAEAEVAVDKPSFRFGGTLDGILFDGSGFEFKTINPNGYAQVMTYGPKAMHVLQVHSYMILRPDITKFSIVYEDKGSSEWREFRVEKDPKVAKELDRELGALNEHLDNRTMPKMLADCETKEGYVYRSCPFREICPKVKGWPTVVDNKVVGV